METSKKKIRQQMSVINPIPVLSCTVPYTDLVGGAVAKGKNDAAQTISVKRLLPPRRGRWELRPVRVVRSDAGLPCDAGSVADRWGWVIGAASQGATRRRSRWLAGVGDRIVTIG